MRLALLVVMLAALLAVPLARANGDPASDILLTEPVYFPIDATLSDSDREALLKTIDEADKRGYKIRVALIPFTSDLGTAVSLWRHPQDYSKFLGKELAFVYRNRLLIVQPSGFGFYNQGKPVAKEQRVLAKIPVGKTPAEQTRSADAAVRALAAADGVKLPVAKTKSTATRDRLIIVLAGLVILLIIFVPGRWLRRGRKPLEKGTPEPD
jgi:hypothetical protein